MMKDTFQVGDLAMLIRTDSPEYYIYVGHVFEILSPLIQTPFDYMGHEVTPVNPPYRAWCTPEYLMKITPPPEMREEERQDELCLS